MTVEFHPKCKERLVVKLAEILPKLEVENNTLLSAISTVGLFLVEQVLPQKGGVRDALTDYIEEYPLVHFIFERIAADIRYANEFDDTAPQKPLTSFGRYADAGAAAERLIAEVESLPWQYMLSVQLPENVSSAFAAIRSDFEITGVARVRQNNEEFRRQFRLETGNAIKDRVIIPPRSLLFIDEPVSWTENRLVFQMSMSGFVARNRHLNTVRKAIADIKAFCGLALAVRLLKLEKTNQVLRPNLSAYVHKIDAGEAELDSRVEFDEDLSRGFSELVYHEVNLTAKTEEIRIKWFENDIATIGRVFDAGEKSSRIRLAAQWLFDSHCGRNELLQFVQRMVALEILLGDKRVSNEIGLGELLKNRCAYLISRNHEERIQLIKELGQIYDIRSQIVHSGKARFALGEQSLSDRLYSICQRVLQAEMNLLAADNPKGS